MELQKQHCVCLTEGGEHSSGSPVQGNIVVIMVSGGALYQVCVWFVTKRVLCESQNPPLISAHLSEGPWAGSALRGHGSRSLCCKERDFHKVSLFTFLPHLYCFLF